MEMTIQKPFEVVAIFDNVDQSLDRYTVVVDIDREDEFEQYTVASNGVCSIWSVGDSVFDYESVDEDDVNIGIDIEWGQLPMTLQKTIISYFELN